MKEVELSAAALREQTALQASTEQMRTERLELPAQNRALRTLIKREERLAAHLREVPGASRAEADQVAEITREKIVLSDERESLTFYSVPSGRTVSPSE